MYQQAALTLSRWNSTQTHACLNFTIVFLFIRTHSSQSCRSCLHVLILLNIPKLIAMQPSWLDTWRYRFLKLAEYQIQGIAISTALKNGNTNLSDTLPVGSFQESYRTILRPRDPPISFMLWCQAEPFWGMHWFEKSAFRHGNTVSLVTKLIRHKVRSLSRSFKARCCSCAAAWGADAMCLCQDELRR